MTFFEKLVRKSSGKIVEALERQLSEVNFLREEDKLDPILARTQGHKIKVEESNFNK